MERHFIVTFQAWLGRLRSDGHVVCPASSAVPVELRVVRPDGVGLHFRCRGVRVRLGWYRPGRAAWQTPIRDERWCPEESLELWEHRPVEPAGEVPDYGRLVFPDGGEPDRQVILDGAREWGWRSHEAGLLRAASAAVLFTRLLAVAEGIACVSALDRDGGGLLTAEAPEPWEGGGSADIPALPFLIPPARSAQPAPAGARVR
jgi:hypothetical protein